jgi:hemerythrin
MTIEWTDAFRIGIPSLDDDHQKLVDVANHFFEQVQNGADTPVIAIILDQIVALMGSHFVREEDELDRHDYLNRLSHAAMHQQEMLRLQRFAELFKSGELTREQTIAQAECLCQFLIKHIVEDDIPFKSALRTLT